MKKHISTWPRKQHNDPDTKCKGTKAGAIHRVNPPGTGGITRKLNRLAERLK